VDNRSYLGRLYQEFEGVSRGTLAACSLDKKGNWGYNRIASDNLSDRLGDLRESSLYSSFWSDRRSTSSIKELGETLTSGQQSKREEKCHWYPLLK